MYRRRNLKGTKLKTAYRCRSPKLYRKLLDEGLTNWELQFTDFSLLRYIRPKRADQTFDDRIVEIESAAPGRTSEQFVAGNLDHIVQHWPPRCWPSMRTNPFNHSTEAHDQ